MTIKKQIYGEIYKDIMSKEIQNETKRKELVTIFEILSYIKKRKQDKDEECKILLDELNIEGIDSIEFTSFNYLDNTRIVISLNNLINLYYGLDNSFSIYNIDSNNKELYYDILKEKQKVLYELTKYALKHNYEKDFHINTISNNFRLSIGGDYLDIAIASKFIKKEYFRLAYAPYESDGIIIGEDLYLKTNIKKVRDLFLKSNPEVQKLYTGESNPTIRFLNNIAVYKSDLPEYIIEGVENLTLKK